MGKIRYVCTTCANGFTTKSAALRHLRNVEFGKGTVVTEASYRSGLVTGIFFPVVPSIPPSYKKIAPVSSTANSKSVINADEFHRGFWRRAGELFCEEIFNDSKRRPMLEANIQLFLLEETRKIMAGTSPR
ncbi:MAG: hypothetical protein ABI347_08595 [Nitrososphaera sp.]|jgi:hypothetical protein